jgi:hypothetical protein
VPSHLCPVGISQKHSPATAEQVFKAHLSIINHQGLPSSTKRRPVASGFSGLFLGSNHHRHLGNAQDRLKDSSTPGPGSQMRARPNAFRDNAFRDSTEMRGGASGSADVPVGMANESANEEAVIDEPLASHSQANEDVGAPDKPGIVHRHKNRWMMNP